MGIGEFRHRIKIIDFSSEYDEWGNPIIEERIMGNPWAKVTNVYGREFFAASAVQLEKMVLFTIRYIPDLDETMHIMFRGDKYNINFIDNIKYKNKYLEIKALLA